MPANKGLGMKLKKLFLNETLIVTILAVIMGLLVGAVVLALAGYDPVKAYGTMLKGVVSKPKYLAQTVVYSMPVILTGMSIAFAFRTGLFNIGAEGQFMIGALTAAVLGYALELPAIIHIPVVLVGATLAAALFGGLSGWLKARYGVHEVISTIMLNWFALYFSNFVVYIPSLKNPGPESTYDIHETARLTIDGLKWLVGPGVKVSWGIVISLVVVAAVAYYLFKTVQGFELRAVGFNKEAARYAGINVDACVVKSMAIAGGLAGLAGALQVSGVSYHVSKLAVSEGYGFNGIAVALIGNSSPIGVVLGGILFSALNYGGTKMQSLQVPSEVVSIVIGAIIFFIAISRIFKPLLRPLKKIVGEEE